MKKLQYNFTSIIIILLAAVFTLNSCGFLEDFNRQKREDSYKAFDYSIKDATLEMENIEYYCSLYVNGEYMECYNCKDFPELKDSLATIEGYGDLKVEGFASFDEKDFLDATEVIQAKLKDYPELMGKITKQYDIAKETESAKCTECLQEEMNKFAKLDEQLIKDIAPFITKEEYENKEFNKKYSFDFNKYGYNSRDTYWKPVCKKLMKHNDHAICIGDKLISCINSNTCEHKETNLAKDYCNSN